MALSHPAHVVQYHQAHKGFVAYDPKKGTREPMRGVRPTIKKTFFPGYKWETANNAPGVPNDIDTRECAALKVVSAAGGSKRIGTALGSKVDRQFCAVIKTGQPFSKWLEDKKKKTPQAWNPAWAKLKKELSPVTRAIVQLCVNNKWTPVDAQVTCASLRMRVGTAVDAIVRDEKNRLILLEIKTGGGLSVVKADGQMLHELSAVSNGIYHQYHLQHCVTRMCFEETFPETPVHRAVVVMAGRTGAAGQDVLPRIWGLADKVRARLVENRVTKATARKHSKRAAQLQAIAQAIASTGSCNALAAEARARQARKVVGQLRPKAKAKGGKGGTRARGKGKGGAKAKRK